MAWVVRDPWYFHDFEWHTVYLSMQPQIYVATPWRLISSIGGVFGIISIIKEDTRLLCLGLLGVFLGFIGLLSPAPFRGGPPESTFYPLLLPASILTFLGVATMFSSFVYKFGGWYRLALFSVPILGTYYLLPPIIALFDLQLYAHLSYYLTHGITLHLFLPIFGLILALLGCILCFIKTLTSSLTKEISKGVDRDV